MKVLLTTLNAKYIHTNLAIRILYEMNENYDGLKWKEFSIKEDKNQIADYCKDFDLIAFSCYIWNITPTLEVIKIIKSINPKIKILLGGPEVSYEYENVIALPEIDFIIYGEGETPFQTLLQKYGEWESIPSLVWKNSKGEIKINASSPTYDIKLFADSMPYRFDDPEELKNKVLYIETSRGCPYKCEFCLASLDNKVRYLPMESIKRTLLYMMQNGKVVKFLDRTFNIKKDFTLEIFQFILENYREGNVFQFEITADILHPDIIKYVNEKVPKDLFRFEIGIQSVNQKANLAVSRKQNFEKTTSIINAVRDKVELHLDLIVGLPHDYFDDIKHGIEEVFKLHPPEFQLGFLKFLKGTPVREKYPEHEYVFDVNPPYQIISSKFLSNEDLTKITRLEEALEIYWNSKRAIHSLKYVESKYSIFEYLKELGKLFHSKFHLKQYGLSDIYETIHEYNSTQFPEDKILQELTAIDYYLQYKVKPKEFIIAELPKDEKNKFINENKLNHHLFRFIILPISFDFEKFSNENKIELASEKLVIQYSGTEKPWIVQTEKKATNYTNFTN
jgi:anaerobic magnesium-protoporphyrin IX monomethyl ester cyclase